MPLPVLTRPWGSVSLDFVTNLLPLRGVNSILIVTDWLTKMAHFIATTKTVTAEGTATLFLGDIVRLHGLPDDAMSN